MPAQKINKKWKCYKTIFKGLIHSFYDYGKGSQRKTAQRVEIFHKLKPYRWYFGGLSFII